MTKGYGNYLGKDHLETPMVFKCNQDFEVRDLWSKYYNNGRRNLRKRIGYLIAPREVVSRPRIGMINENMKEEYFNQAKKLKLSCFPNFIPGHIKFEDSIDVKNPKGPKFT
eukprot:NODE_500_length_7578_cov_0.067790.p4 type:complete len:111 gc:universal NODE_500_length_7578_cov_0.067790:855-523(-)